MTTLIIAKNHFLNNKIIDKFSFAYTNFQMFIFNMRILVYVLNNYL